MPCRETRRGFGVTEAITATANNHKPDQIMKTKIIPIRYNPNGERLTWRVWREPRICGSHYTGPAWAWQDEDGLTRYGPPTWREFVPYIRDYFASHNVSPLVDL